MYEVNATIDCKQAIDEYIGNTDWRVRANSNTTYSNAGLVNNTAGKVIATYWLNNIYSPEEGAAHRNGDYHIHDLDCLTGYCAGWNLRSLLAEGFNGVRSRVNSKPPRHLREALGQMANFLGILQSEWAGAQAFSSFDTFLAPYVFKDKMSFKNLKKAIRSFVYNLNVPSRWGQCVKEEYKCLRGDGKWVTHHDLKPGDEIYVVDPSTGVLKKDVLTHVNVFDAPEKMHRYYNNQGFNFEVTDNHRVIYKTGSNGFSIKLSSELINRNSTIDIPISAWGSQTPNDFFGNEYDIDDELLEFVTFIMCDGCIVHQEGKAARLEFYKSPTRYGCDRFEELCDILKIKYSKKLTQSATFKTPITVYRLHNNAEVAKVIELLDADKHKTPDFVQYLSPRQCYIMLDRWVTLDGHFDGSHWKMQADTESIQEMLAFLAVRAGKAAALHQRYIGENKTATKYTTVYKRGCRSCSVEEVESSTKKVWCPTTNTGTFICMTDEGYIFFTGNSPFTNITIDWTVPDDLKEDMPLCGAEHLLYGINDSELIAKAKERGVDVLHNMTYKHFQPEMNMIQKAYYEVMTEGDSTGQPFTFPIPTVNITEEFDWEGENVLTLFENAAKIGSSYFQNFVGSQYKIDENGNRVEDEEAYKPSAVRSMAFTPTQEFVYKDNEGRVTRSTLSKIYDAWEANMATAKGCKYEFMFNGKFYPITEMFKIDYSEYDRTKTIILDNGYSFGVSVDHKCLVYDPVKKKTYNKLSQDIVSGDLIPVASKRWDTSSTHGSYEAGKVIGYYLAEGWSDDCRVYFAINSNREDIVNDIKTLFESLGIEVIVDKQDAVNIYKVTAYGSGAVAYVHQFVTGKTAKQKRLYRYTWNTSTDFRQGLFDGYVETDGCGKDSNVVAHTTNKDLCDDLICLASSLGIVLKFSVNKKNTRYFKADKSDKVTFTSYRLCRFASTTKNGVYYIPVREVKDVMRAPQFVYNFTIGNDDHLVELSNGIISPQCCRLQLDLNELRKRGNGLFGSAESTGSVGVVTINLARLGYRFKGDKEGLYKELDRLMELAKSTLEKKRVFITDMYNRGLYPYTKRYLPAGFRNHFSTIGVNGGNEMIRNFTNDEYDITTEWGRQFAEDLLNHIRKRMREFQNETGNLYNLEASPGEGATHRFAREDIKRYPDIIQAGCKEKGQIYYTNSTQLPAWYTEDLFMALKLQDKLQTRYTGGCVEAGNYVITDKGRILIDELCSNKEKYKGIKVISYNIDTNTSEWDTVTDFHKIDVSDKDKIRIKGKASLDITTSDWHPFFIVTPGGKVEERRADELKPGDYLLQNSTSLLNTADTELTPELAYVLGFYIGDGSMFKTIDNRGGNNIEKFIVRFHHTNKERLNRVASILRKNGLANITPHYCDKRSNKLMCLSTSAKAMTSFLNKYGFKAGKKALTVCLSDTLKESLNEANAYALLSGLFDTDSYLDPKYDNIEYFTGSKAMAEDVLWMANMLGIRCSLTVKHDARYDHPHFKLLFPARQLYKIEDRLMCTRRPAGIYKNSAERNAAVKGKYNVVMVTEVSKVDVKDNIFYDLTTEKNHNYLCGKTCYTFIHNTVFHMYMSEMISSPEACRDIVRKVLTNFKMPYITVTPLFSVCDKHGYLKGRHDFCPLCDEEILANARKES